MLLGRIKTEKEKTKPRTSRGERHPTRQGKTKRALKGGIMKQPKHTTTAKGSFLDAAATILKRARDPLTHQEITDRALASALLHSVGKTPERTMSAALYMDVLHNPKSRFRRIAEAGPTRARRNSVKWALR
jgi:hypothetical protein